MMHSNSNVLQYINVFTISLVVVSLQKVIFASFTRRDTHVSRVRAYVRACVRFADVDGIEMTELPVVECIRYDTIQRRVSNRRACSANTRGT